MRQVGEPMIGAKAPGWLKPETVTRSPGAGAGRPMFSTNTPPVASCRKNCPFQSGSAAVTMPVTVMPSRRPACSAVNESNEAAVVSGSSGSTARTPVRSMCTEAERQQDGPKKHSYRHGEEGEQRAPEADGAEVLPLLHFVPNTGIFQAQLFPLERGMFAGART
jgi:hypothetical protein